MNTQEFVTQIVLKYMFPVQDAEVEYWKQK